ncbi:MAG: hypothetical protein KH338_02025 [Oscillospiraceae bacterium]|nr:hypothetical protein [Oscillospiraceae bacterium]
MKKKILTLVLAMAMVLGCIFTSYAAPVAGELIGGERLVISDDALTNYDPVYFKEGDDGTYIETYASNLTLELSIVDYLTGGLPRNQMLTTKNNVGSIKLRDFEGDSVRIRLTNLEYESTGYIRGGLATYNEANGTFDAEAYITLDISAGSNVDTAYDTFPINGTSLQYKKDAKMYGFINNRTGGNLTYGELKVYDFNI